MKTQEEGAFKYDLVGRAEQGILLNDTFCHHFSDVFGYIVVFKGVLMNGRQWCHLAAKGRVQNITAITKIARWPGNSIVAGKQNRQPLLPVFSPE
ncbi:hypothetical protein [Oceanisphaera psychrotolerans]|uniref:hypothetical protein n=1 Tax=Oceanisphaera psychrotolerans TaxID=1414654 RepID=UPI001113D213|nr:hypothetical protein [Oceanisphaera psychrotolerans]